MRSHDKYKLHDSADIARHARSPSDEGRILPRYIGQLIRRGCKGLHNPASFRHALGCCRSQGTLLLMELIRYITGIYMSKGIPPLRHDASV